MTGNPHPEFWRGQPVTVTGGAGFLGSALVRDLRALGAEVKVIRSAEHDLTDARACRAALTGARIVFHLAARVGGIGFNRRNPAPLVHENLLMGANVFEQSRQCGAKKLVAACTVCAYPKHTPTPFQEERLWDGYPEESNAPYGLAKKMLLVLSDAFRRQYGLESCVPIIANLYGPGDNFDLADSHVIAAMIRKFAEAREHGDESVTLWGTGSASREFLYVADAVRALILAGERLNSSEPVNVGTGQETRIHDLAEMVRELTGYAGEIVWDSSYPDGQPSRSLDVRRAEQLMGFKAEIGLREGLRHTIESFEPGSTEALSPRL